MKRLSAFLLFAFLATLMLAIPALAADLQEGWYAWPMSVDVYADVAGGPYGDTGWRKATVTSNAYGAGPADSLLLPMGFGMTIGERFMYIHVSWATDYDATQMQLELWRNRYGGATERVWAQPLSGTRSGSFDTLYGGEFEGTFFYRVAVIPEPASCLSLATMVSIMGLAVLVTRRKKI
jgi:hypothetical protein